MLQSYLTDPNGIKSSGRLIACYLVVVGVLAYPAGLVMPLSSDYTGKFTGQCFAYASIFYGATKGYDSFNFVKDKLSAWIGNKAAAANTTETAKPQGDA